MMSNELGPQNSWQCVRRAKLYLDLLQASNRKPPGLQQRRPFKAIFGLTPGFKQKAPGFIADETIQSYIWTYSRLQTESPRVYSRGDHSKLYLDLLQASNRKPPGLQQRRPFGIHKTVVKLGNYNIH